VSALDAIRCIETFVISLPREVPYLGPLRPGESINARGYLVRLGNKTIYPSTDMSVLIKITGESGLVGWGETYGVAAPEAVTSIIDDLLAPVLLGRDPATPRVLHEDLYDLMRVRGFFGGYYVDALAGVDIAIWDLLGQLLRVPLSTLLGGQRREALPAYVSGLPRATLRERCDLAVEWVASGFRAIKFAAVVSDDGVVREMAALREAVGSDVQIMADLHWKFSAPDAIRLIRRLAEYDLAFAEAPCQPEDLEGQVMVARAGLAPVALGEELRTVFEYRPRFEARAMGVIQPEMGHTGVTEFMQICDMARTFHIPVMPHASISCGIFMAASLQAASTLQTMPFHEYQHSIFDKSLALVTGTMACADGFYTMPQGPGLGVKPRDALFSHVRSQTRCT
jgi:L-alanine-DL-glutamate epimerase-like enolase superfamily enzyme